MTKPARRRELQAEREAEEQRRAENPTEEEKMLQRLDAILCSGTNNDAVEELARILRWHITGSEY